METLKDGSQTQDRRLDRIYQQDLRSLNFLVRNTIPISLDYRPRSYTWSCDRFLDQGQEGACVGFGFSHDLAARPVPVAGLTNEYARGVYWDAQRADEWEGGSYDGAAPFYEGTSVLAGAKVLTDRGFYSGYTWALNVLDVVAGLAYKGPCVFGFNWYEGMFNTDANGFIAPTGRLSGGHCIMANSVKIKWKNPITAIFKKDWENVDWDRSYVVVHNSWGPDWGNRGTAKLSFNSLERLLGEQGDAVFPLRVTTKRKIG